MLLDEVRHEKNYFKLMSEHKEIFRAMQSFNSGLSLLEPELNAFSKKLFEDHCYLWSTEVENSLKSFAESNPLAADIRDEFSNFDSRTEQLQNVDRTRVIGSFIIDLTEVYDDFVEYSKKWKSILGKLLSDIYVKKLKESIAYMDDIEFTLERSLNDFDDISNAMKCLENVRENSIK